MGTEANCDNCGKFHPTTTCKEAKESDLLQRGVMPRAFMEECYKKFIRKAKENNRTLQPWKEESGNFLRDRLEEEKEELFDAMFDGDHEAIMDECLDVAKFETALPNLNRNLTISGWSPTPVLFSISVKSLLPHTGQGFSRSI